MKKSVPQGSSFPTRSLLKTLIIMKLAIFIILFSSLQVKANDAGAQNISVSVKNTEIRKVLNAIERNANYRFLYNYDLQGLKNKVDFIADNLSLDQALDKLFTGSGLTYKIVRKNLVAVLSVNQENNQAVPVTGKITGPNDEPLAGASILEKGTTNGTTTNNSGEFSMTVADNATLIVSIIGYEPQEIAVAGRNVVDVKMAPSVKQMDQVIVVGYGSQRKIDVTGSVATIKGEEISKQSSINPISSLQGKVAGVQITNLGAPGSSPQVRIRGVGTTAGDPSPLYVVDGVWVSDVSYLNPADIENISILKDASSEAIYGIRAANGVILITTKKGRRNGQPVINYNGYVGYQVVTNDVKMATGPEYAQMVNELDAIGGVTPRYADPNSYGNTDWYHQILRNAATTNHQVSVTGGGEKSSYNFSLGYLLQDGLVKTNKFERYTAKLQNDFQVLNSLRLGYIVSASMNKSNDINGSIFHQLYAGVPIVPVYYADGTYGDPNDFNVTSSANFNPQVTVDFYDQQSKNYRITGNAYGELRFAKNFMFRSSIGGDFGQNEVNNYLPQYTATLAQRSTISRLTVTEGSTRNWILENTLTYDRKFGDHSLKVLAGQGAQSFDFYQTISSAENVPNNSSGDHYLSLGNNRQVMDNGTLYTVASYFGRVNYGYKDRYMLTGTFRADGSSKFPGNQWGYFPSVGASWIITQEGFMKDQTFFNSLKLRASWGKIGNLSVPANIPVLKVTQTDQFIYVGGNGSTAPGANINTIVPPATYWEKGVGTDVAVEASMMKNRLYAEINFYNKETQDAIFSIPILQSLGTSGSTIVGNQATFRNQGLEVLLTWRDKTSKDFSYSLSGNLSYNQNKVTEVTSGSNPIYKAVGTTGSNNYNTRTVVGQPIGQFYGLQATGVFQNQAEIDNYKSKAGVVIMPTAKPGDLIMEDVNGDGQIDDKDRIVLGNPNPKFIYGINTSFAYKQFDLTLDFQGVSGVEIYNANIGLRFGTENFTQDFYDNRWHGDGTSNNYPSVFLAGGQNPRSSSFYVSNGSYFRVRNAQLGYTLSSSLMEKWKLSQLRFFLNAQNPLNFFSYKGFSPEVGGNPTEAGVDYNVYPLYATYTFGVNLSF